MDAAQTVRMAKQIVSILKAKFRVHVTVEIVDERGTSQNTDANRRGARDRLAARMIAFRSGKSFIMK